MEQIDYYFSPMSPWSYLGHERLAQIAEKHRIGISLKPVDFGRIFPLSGGLPLGKRAPQRQKYRLVELERWRDYLDVPLTIQPKFFPYDVALASCLIVATLPKGQDAAMRLAGALMKACWADERNMADEGELSAVAKAQGLDAAGLLAAAKATKSKAHYDAFTEEAIQRDVFGAPTYVFNGKPFWGQDRLDFLDRELAKAQS